MSDKDPIKEEEEEKEKAVSSPPAAPGSGPPSMSSPSTDQGAVAPSETLGPANSAAAAARDGRSFSQLLAGAMASPAGSPRGAPILAVPVVAVPCFLAPASLLESQGFTGQFAMTHQAVLATVTAQAQMHLQASYSPSSETSTNPFPQPMLTPVNLAPLQQRPPQTPESEQPPSSNHKGQNTQIVVKPISSDGYNWRKYGQKQVKSSDRSRSYYKCTDVNCSAKKKVERCPDGRETEIIYRGQHNHDPPRKTRCTKEKGIQPSGPGGESETLDLLSSEVNESDPPAPKAEQTSGNETPERQLYCSSDCEGDAAIKTEEEHVDEPDAKRRIIESTTPYSPPVLKMIKEPKVVVQSASDAATVGDGYRWRKYGQKIVKGNPNPRSYYRCTQTGCPVRKHVERASGDTKAIVITYEGKHNHDQPPIKSSSDQPPPALLVAGGGGAVPEVNKDEELHSSNSSDEKLSKDGEEVAAAAGDKALELGGEKALESAQTLLSIGFNSSAEKEANGNNSDGKNESLFSEKKCSAVPVQNS